MYRTCDLESVEDSNKIVRKNITEKNAVEGLGIQVASLPGSWIVKRVHGFSLFED